MNTKNLVIAFSICGEGHGHYGRNIEIIKSLSHHFPYAAINLYIYGDTLNIFLKDKNLPKNVTIYQIPGFKYSYKKEGFVTSLASTATNFNNFAVFCRIIKLNILCSVFSPIFKKLDKISTRPSRFIQNYYNKYFGYFDFAITDLEPLLPRVALMRNKPFLTYDNQHAMLYGDLEINKFNFSERLEHFFISNFLKFYHPRSDLSILTSFCKIPLKSKYTDRVVTIGPLIRNDILSIKNEAVYEDFILIYAHKILRENLFPIITKLPQYKFVIFTTDYFAEKNYPFKRNWIEFHSIDPVKFIDYLKRCKAVISTAGNTLISEAIFLKKPFFAIGLEGQFEQRLNLHILIKNRWGEGCKISELTARQVTHFLDHITEYQNILHEAEITDHTENMVSLIINKMKQDITHLQYEIPKPMIAANSSGRITR